MTTLTQKGEREGMNPLLTLQGIYDIEAQYNQQPSIQVLHELKKMYLTEKRGYLKKKIPEQFPPFYKIALMLNSIALSVRETFSNLNNNIVEE